MATTRGDINTQTVLGGLVELVAKGEAGADVQLNRTLTFLMPTVPTYAAVQVAELLMKLHHEAALENQRKAAEN